MTDTSEQPGHEPDQSVIDIAPIPAYEYPSKSPGTRSRPGDTSPEPIERPNVCAECGRPAIGMFGDTWFCQSCGDTAFKNWHKPGPEIKHPEARSFEEWWRLEQQPIAETPSPLPTRTKPFLPARREPLPEQEYTSIPVSPGRVRSRPEVPTSQVEPRVFNHPATTSLLPEASPETEAKPEKRTKEFPQTPQAEKVSSGNATKSGKRKTLKLFNGRAGRKHKEWQIEDILDNYLQTGRLPHYVSDRQHRYYKQHRTLPERRKLLRERGKTVIIPETSSTSGNIIPMGKRNTYHSKRKTGSV